MRQGAVSGAPKIWLQLEGAAVLVFALLLSLIAGSARAQVCNGTASFAAGAVRIGAGASTTEGARSFGGELAVGRSQGAFGRLGISTVDFDDLVGNATGIDVTAGVAEPLAAAENVDVCPTLGIAVQAASGLQSPFGALDLSARAVSLGIGVGTTLASRFFDLVPSLQGAYVINRTVATLDGVADTTTTDFMSVQIGGGLVFWKALTIQPSFTFFPLGLDDPDPVYAVSISYNFGGGSIVRRRRL